MNPVQSWLNNITNVTAEEIADIEKITKTSSVKANKIIHKQGQVSDKIGFLVNGAARTYFIDSNGNEKTVGFSFEGDALLAIGSFIHQLPSQISSITLEPSEIIWTDYKNFTIFANKYPRYHNILISGLAKWFSENNKQREYMNQPTAKSKYQSLSELQPEIIERVPLKYIASYLGITQETLSRIRSNK